MPRGQFRASSRQRCKQTEGSALSRNFCEDVDAYSLWHVFWTVEDIARHGCFISTYLRLGRATSDTKLTTIAHFRLWQWPPLQHLQHHLPPAIMTHHGAKCLDRICTGPCHGPISSEVYHLLPQSIILQSNAPSHSPWETAQTMRCPYRL